MPRLDGTGPRGNGPKTGRGLGNCIPEVNNKVTKNEIVNQGLFRGMGLRRGQNNRGN